MIVFYLPDLRGGGAERVMLNILDLYNQKFHSKIVLLLGKRQGDLIHLIPKDIKVFELGKTSALKSVIPFIQFCKKHKPDKVIASLGASLATALAKPFISKKIEIINRLGNTIGAEKLLFKSSFKQNLYIQANKIIAKNSDKIIFQCHYMANDFIKETGVTPKSYKVIHNPVNTENVNRLKNEVNPKVQDFVAIGRLSPQKDYFTLVQAFDILKNKFNKNYVVRVLGDGELKEDLLKDIKQKNLTENVILEGYTANPYSFLQNSKALISTSLFEGFSNVIVESLCLGIPVIASNCPGANSEVLKEGENGFLFETRNAKNLAETLLKNHDELIHFENDKISNEAIRRFSLEKIFLEYDDYFEL